MHDHLAHLAALEAVVDVIRTKAGAQGVDHRAEIHPQRGHLQPVGHQLNLGSAGGKAGGDPLKLTGGRGGPNEGAGFDLKAFEIHLAIAGVEQFQFQAPLRAEAPHRGGLTQLHHGPPHVAAQLGIQPFAHGGGGGFRPPAGFDRCQAQKEGALVGAVVTEGAAGVEVGPGDQGFARHRLAHLIQDGLGLLEAQAIGQDHHPPQLAIVFLGNEAGGARLQHDSRDHQAGQQQPHHEPALVHHPIEPTAVGLLEGLQGPPGGIHPAQQPFRFCLVWFEQSACS